MFAQPATVAGRSAWPKRPMLQGSEPKVYVRPLHHHLNLGFALGREPRHPSYLARQEPQPDGHLASGRESRACCSIHFAVPQQLGSADVDRSGTSFAV